MEKTGTNYQMLSIGDIQTLGRVTFKEKLALTGSEISVNELPAGVSAEVIPDELYDGRRSRRRPCP
mgnify:CR=1 FL=1